MVSIRKRVGRTETIYFILMIIAAIAALTMTGLPMFTDLRGQAFSSKKQINWIGKVVLLCLFVALVCAFTATIHQQKTAISELERHRTLLETIQLEALRLVPSDFQLRMISQTERNPGPATSLDNIRPIYVEGELGRAKFACEFHEVGDHLQRRAMVTDTRFYGLTSDPRAYGHSLELLTSYCQ
jgi:hypothetical protein